MKHSIAAALVVSMGLTGCIFGGRAEPDPGDSNGAVNGATNGNAQTNGTPNGETNIGPANSMNGETNLNNGSSNNENNIATNGDTVPTNSATCESALDEPIGPCDPHCQDCGPGENCVFASDGSPGVSSSCVAEGAAGEGDECMLGQDDCELGLVCTDAANDAPTTCREICDPRADAECIGTGRVCVPRPGNEQLGFCLQTAGTVLIEDTSSGADACNIDAPGSDIFGVELFDDDGSIAWGEVLMNDGVERTANAYSSTLPIDGAMPSLDGDRCPFEFTDDTIAALGCGGWIAVRFRNQGGNPIFLNSTHRIRVHEYGMECNGQNNFDRYRVALCRVGNEIPESCTTILGSDLDGTATVDATEI